MGLTTAEIRDRAERFRAAFHEELYEARSGRKAWPERAPLFEHQSVLVAAETLPVIEREIASADEEEERRLRRLLRWTARHHLEHATARLDDEHSYWMATAKLEVDDTAIPVSQASDAAHSATTRQARRRLSEEYCLLLEESASLQLDRLSRWREAALELGYGGYRDAVERLAGVNLSGVLQEGRRLLDGTEDAYADLLKDELASRLGIGPADAEAHDLGWLLRMPWLDGSCQEAGILGSLRKDLRDIGLPLEIGGHVRLEHESFPGPGMRPYCAPVRVPRQVNLLVTPTLTQPACRALLGEVGRALHFACTDDRLSFEDRALGDMAVPEAHGLLIEGLSRCAPWVRRARGLSGDRLEGYLRSAALADLVSLRRAVGRLEFELELADSDQPAAMGPRWAELLRSATGVRHDPRSFLETLGQRFGVARHLRGRMLAAQLQRELRERFDEDWYRNPRTGPFLGGWLANGMRFTAVELATRLGGDRLGADALLRSTVEALP